MKKKTVNQKWELDESRPPPAMELVADSGAQVVSVGHISKIGLIEEQLLSTRVLPKEFPEVERFLPKEAC